MILTLTPNPALDLTYVADGVRVHGEHRVREVRAAAGGKGVNVARVLAALGREAICAGPLSGGVGQELRELLQPVPAIRQAWTPIAGTTRRTVTVVDPGGATGFNEPGPTLSEHEVQALHDDLLAQVSGSEPQIDAVTVNGSLPPGISGADLASLVGAVREQGRPVLVDTSGPALLAAAHAEATMLKPNAAEAMEATGAETPVEAAAALIEMGAGSVVCSLGSDGMLAVQSRDPAQGPHRAWRAHLPEPLNGNPTGAGDALVAVLASRLAAGAAAVLPDALARAVAVSASAVTRPVAGEVDLDLAAQLEAAVQIEEIRCP